MTPKHPALALIALAALCIVGIILLAFTEHAIPDVLSGIAIAAVSGGAGAAVPTAIANSRRSS